MNSGSSQAFSPALGLEGDEGDCLCNANTAKHHRSSEGSYSNCRHKAQKEIISFTR